MSVLRCEWTVSRLGERTRGPRPERETTHPTTWANFALAFDWETTRRAWREDLNLLWWRLCELKEDGAYV